MGKSRPAAAPTSPPPYEDRDEVPPQDYQPVRISTGRARPEAERIPLFYLDGVEYTAPATVPVQVALDAIRLARRTGWADAMWFVIEQSVGEKAINELAAHAEQDELDAVITRLRQLYLGQIEAVGSGK